MKEYLKDKTGLIMFGVIIVIMGLAHCASPPEEPSRTVDEIIIENRQIRADTTD